MDPYRDRMQRPEQHQGFRKRGRPTLAEVAARQQAMERASRQQLGLPEPVELEPAPPELGQPDPPAPTAATTVTAPLAIELPRHVPPQACPHCGRGMQPRLPGGAYISGGQAFQPCVCSLCGKSFVYQFPKVIA